MIFKKTGQEAILNSILEVLLGSGLLTILKTELKTDANPFPSLMDFFIGRTKSEAYPEEDRGRFVDMFSVLRRPVIDWTGEDLNKIIEYSRACHMENSWPIKQTEHNCSYGDLLDTFNCCVRNAEGGGIFALIDFFTLNFLDTPEVLKIIKESLYKSHPTVVLMFDYCSEEEHPFIEMLSEYFAVASNPNNAIVLFGGTLPKRNFGVVFSSGFSILSDKVRDLCCSIQVINSWKYEGARIVPNHYSVYALLIGVMIKRLLESTEPKWLV